LVVLGGFGLTGFEHVSAMKARFHTLLQSLKLIFRHPAGEYGKLAFSAHAIQRRLGERSRQCKRHAGVLDALAKAGQVIADHQAMRGMTLFQTRSLGFEELADFLGVTLQLGGHRQIAPASLRQHAAHAFGAAARTGDHGKGQAFMDIEHR
jgi:hypothetical protein